MDHARQTSSRQHYLSVLAASVLSMVAWGALVLKFYVRARSLPIYNVPSMVVAAVILGLGIASLVLSMRSIAGLVQGSASLVRIRTDHRALFCLAAGWSAVAALYLALVLVYGPLLGDDRP